MRKSPTQIFVSRVTDKHSSVSAFLQAFMKPDRLCASFFITSEDVKRLQCIGWYCAETDSVQESFPSYEQRRGEVGYRLREL